MNYFSPRWSQEVHCMAQNQSPAQARCESHTRGTWRIMRFSSQLLASFGWGWLWKVASASGSGAPPVPPAQGHKSLCWAAMGRRGWEQGDPGEPRVSAGSRLHMSPMATTRPGAVRGSALTWSLGTWWAWPGCWCTCGRPRQCGRVRWILWAVLE